MANLAIKGHPTRGKEVIEILEMLGGINDAAYDGDLGFAYYFINDNYIDWCHELIPESNFICFTLEEFLEKFPFKVGNKVQHKGATSCGSIYIIEQMKWEDNQVKYIICNLYWKNCKHVLTSKDLQPYKKETMEEINIDRIGFNGDKGKLILPDGYEFKTEGKEVYVVKKKLQYPKTYEECCKIIDYALTGETIIGYKASLLRNFQQLLICRDAYWKIAGEQMGLGKPWEPYWTIFEHKFCLGTYKNEVMEECLTIRNRILAFPTKEMRDTFYENFKDLIEQCKKLL